MHQNWITILLTTCLVLETINCWVIREDGDSYAGDTYEAGRAFMDDDSLIGAGDLPDSNLPRVRTKKSAGGDRRKWCGKRLYQALRLTCERSRGKRSAPNLFSSLSRSEPAYPLALDFDTLDLATSMINPLEALQQSKKFRSFQKRGGTRGVSDFCCSRACTIQELQSFCPS